MIAEAATITEETTTDIVVTETETLRSQVGFEYT
jgi:hypothetical protein